MSSDSGSSKSAGEDQLAIVQRQLVLQAQQEGTQKRTFSNWINSQLSKHPQPLVVKDLFTDIQDGHLLLDLLEVLSNEVLLREKGKNIFQSRSNIESALTFLRQRSIKLINIHVEDIVSGKPSIVLGLVWQIILHFHIEGLASILAATDDQQPVKGEGENGVSPTASPSPKRSAKSRWKSSAKKALLLWAQERCAQVGSTNVTDFKSSWKNGMAFLSIIRSLRPDLVDMENLREKSNEDKLREAFRIAEDELQIPRLLEPEDVNVLDPDEKSIMTYVAQFLQYSKNVADPGRDVAHGVNKAMDWLNQEEQTLKNLFAEMKDETYTKKYQAILLFMRKFNERKRVFLVGVESVQAEEQQLIKQSLENITIQIAEWKQQLDHSLPPPLGVIENWFSEVENLMSQELPNSGSHYNIMSLLQSLSVSFKTLMADAATHLESLGSFRNVDDKGILLVPKDQTVAMKTRMEKIQASNFGVLVDYHCSGHYVLALLEESQPKLKSWQVKYKSQESVEDILADYNEFVEDKQFMIHLETAFQKFKELHSQLLTTEGYSDDPEINPSKQYEVIELKYKTFAELALDAKSTLEKVLTCWTQFENNINLITVWLDEQHKISPVNVPMEVLSKWKSVYKSLNRDGDFLIEKTEPKVASRLSRRLRSFNNRWTKYVKHYEEQKEVGHSSKAQKDLSDETQKELMSRLDFAQHPLEEHLPEKDIRRNFESSKSDLETYISGAMSLLGQKVTPDEFISQYEKTLSKFDSQNLDTFLKAADQMKNILSSAKEKLAVDKVSTDLRLRWKVVHDELESYVCQLKIHIEKKRFDNLSCKLEKQILKENASIVAVDVEELVGEHEVVFSDNGCQGELNRCLQAMEALNDRPSTGADSAMVTKLISECTKRKEDLQKCAADHFITLQSHQGKNKIYTHDVSQSENGMKSNICNLNGTSPSKEVPQTGSGHQITGTPEDNETNGSILQMMQQRYDVQTNNLELTIQNAREKLVAESPEEAQDVKQLQRTSHDLQILQAQTENSWSEFEAVSQQLESLLPGIEKKKLSEKRSDLQSDVEAITAEIKMRVQSLSVTLDVLLPIEQEVSILCDSGRQTSVQEMERFTISNIDIVYDKLKEVQSSVEDHIQQCDIATEIVDPSSPADVLAVQSIVHQYKAELEATSETMKEREAVLKDLESFLSSLAATKQSIQAEASVLRMDRTTILESQKNLNQLEQKVYILKEEAEKLDERLKPFDIFLEDPKHGEDTSCQKMVDVFFEKIEIAKHATLQTLRHLEDSQTSGIQSLNATQKDTLQTDDDYMVSRLNQQSQEQEMEQFTVSNIDSVLQKIKDVQSTFENEIEQCDNLDQSASLNQYKMELQTNNEDMKEKETTLKSLETFMSSLEAVKMSIEAESILLAMDRSTLQEKLRNLESLEEDIYRLGQEAEVLDDSLQAAEIVLEDPEYRDKTSCQKMISEFFQKLESAQQAVLRELRDLQEKEASETLSSRQKTLCKHIEDIQDEIERIGLKDPTIHAVQQRMKALIKLEEKLDSFVQEKKSITDALLEPLQTSQGQGLHGWEECEHLMEDTKHYITQSKEQCEVVIELLRKFQRYKTTLTSLTQEAEVTISHQSSYKGKENLQKMLMKVQALKQEIDDHSEHVEEISSICKKLQFHINKIKSFKELPFQEEANMIIDKWLDICEKIDNSNENLTSVVSLWNKILQLSEEIEQWSSLKVKFFEKRILTSDDVRLLNTELQNQEKHLEEIGKKSAEIQNLLQSDEPPLELQVIKTSLLNTITPISEFVSNKAKGMDLSQTTTEFDSSEELVQKREVTEHINGEPLTQTKEENFSMEVEIKAQPTNGQEHNATAAEPRRDEQSERLEALSARLKEVKKMQEHLHTDLQPNVQGKVKQLSSLTQLLQESQDLACPLEELKTEATTGHSPGLYHNQWLEIKHFHESIIWELQDTKQILESRIDEHQRYESLSTALNNKMTSFYEELLNFAGSSRENAPCEQKRQKLQELRDQYEGLQSELSEVSRLAECVKQSTFSKGVTRIQEVVDMSTCKMRGFLERLDYLKPVIEQPYVTPKSKGKKTKKGSKKKQEHTVQATQFTLQLSIESPVQPLEHSVQSTRESAVVESVQHIEEPSAQPLVGSSVQSTRESAVVESVQHIEEPSAQPPVGSSVQSTRESAVVESVQHIEEPSAQPLVGSSVQSTLQPTEKHSLQQSLDASVQPAVRPSMETVEPLLGASVPPIDRHSVQRSVESLVQPTVKPLGQIPMEPSVKPAIQPFVNAAVGPSVQSLEKHSVKHTLDLSIQSTAKSSVQPAVRPTVYTSLETTVQSIKEPSVQPPPVAPSVLPTEQPIEKPSVQHAGKPYIHPSVHHAEEPSVHPTVQPTKKPSVHSAGKPSVLPTVQSIEKASVHHAGEQSVHPTEKASVHRAGEPSVHPTEKASVHHAGEQSVHPTEKASVHRAGEPSVHPTVQPTEKPSVHSAGKPSVHPTVQFIEKASVHHAGEQSVHPTEKASVHRAGEPSVHPTVQPTEKASVHSAEEPSVLPTVQPTEKLSVHSAGKPSVLPTEQSIEKASVHHAGEPYIHPSVHHAGEPSVHPTVQPTEKPSVHSAGKPSVHPTVQSIEKASVHHAGEQSVHPTEKASVHRAGEPSVLPTVQPTEKPSVHHAGEPSVHPTVQPTEKPSVHHAGEPSVLPTVQPTEKPSVHSAEEPSVHPTVQPAGEPSVLPTVPPIEKPSVDHAGEPYIHPSVHHAGEPSVHPTVQPTEKPSVHSAGKPSVHPTVQSIEKASVHHAGEQSVHSTEKASVHRAGEPSVLPTVQPTEKPSVHHAGEPSVLPTVQPTEKPSVHSAEEPSVHPTVQPTEKPSVHSAGEPSVLPTVQPIEKPSVHHAGEPSVHPTVQPIEKPSVDHAAQPSVHPTVQPIEKPSVHNAGEPSVHPTVQPIEKPSVHHAGEPSVHPTEKPSMHSAGKPSVLPTVQSIEKASVHHAGEPSVHPTVQPIEKPSVDHAGEPSVHPTVQPTEKPSVHSAGKPSVHPTVQFIEKASVHHAGEQSVHPTEKASVHHAGEPSVHPTVQPTEKASVHSAEEPSVLPTVQPTEKLSVHSAGKPSVLPTVQSIEKASVHHAGEPSVHPTVQPTEKPSVQHAGEPSVHHTVQLIEKPSVHRAGEPLVHPTVQPIEKPSVDHAGEPPVHPTVQPIEKPSVHRAGEPPVQPIEKPSVDHAGEPPVHPTVQPIEKPSVHRAGEPSVHPTVQPTEKLSEQYELELSLQHTLESSVKPAIQSSMSVHPTGQHTENPPEQSAVEPSVRLTMQPKQQPSDTVTVKEKKASKSRRKKKLNSGIKFNVEKRAMGNQAVTGAISSKADTLDHSGESLSTKIVQKEHYLDVIDSSREAVEEKALEESTDVKGEQGEASGHLQMLLRDCISFRRQLETLQNDWTVCSNDSLRISSLLTTVERKVREAGNLPDEGGKVVILHEVQPLYDEIKSYMGCLAQVSDQAFDEEKKISKENLEDRTGDINIQLAINQNKQTAIEDISAPQSVSFPTEVETLPKELQDRLSAVQQEILLRLTRVGEKQPVAEKPLEKFSCNIKLLFAGEDDKTLSEKSPGRIYKDMKRIISSFKKQPLKLDVKELDQQIQDIEKVHNELSQLPSEQTCFQKENQDGDDQDSERLISKHKDLLVELVALKTEKQKLCQELKNFQEALCAAKRSYQMLAKEKENLKMAPTESYRSHLVKITHFLEKIAKDKEALHALKSVQTNFAGCRITSKNKDEIDLDVKELEEYWEQVELSVHREHDRITKEAKELGFLEQKVVHVQSIIRLQQDLLDQPSTSPEDPLKASVLLSADMQAIRHLFLSLRNACDLQIKRTWGTNDRKSLESLLDNLQSELESLEERVTDQQLTRCQSPNSLLEQYSFLKPVYEPLLWVKRSQNRAAFNQAIALLPEDVEGQITVCKNVHKQILDRKSTIDSAIEESKHISSGIDPALCKDISSFFQQLQELYREQIMQSVERLQQLESGLEKRKALFSEIEKLKELLQCLEKEATPDIRGIFTATDLCEQLNCLKAKTKELEEIEGLVLTLLRNSQSYHGELKNSEQLYLNDILRSLKYKARKIRRLEEKKFSYTEKLLRICNEFEDRTTYLNRELNALQPIEPEIHDEAAKRVGEGFEKKLQVSQNAISSSQDHLSEILRYKDVFEDNRLYWDGLAVDNLQKKFLSLTKDADRSGHFEHFGPVQGHYRELLGKIKAMICSVQKEAVSIGTNFDIIDAEVLCKKMKKISILTTEELRSLHEKSGADEDSLKNEEQTIRSLAEDMDQLHQSLNRVVTDYRTKDTSVQCRLQQTLYNLKKIDRDLQQLLVIELDNYKAQEQLLGLEALHEICKSELHVIRTISSQETTEDLKEQLDEVKYLGKQVERNISQHINTAEKNCNCLQDFQQAIAKVIELFTQYGGKLQVDPVDLNNLENQADVLVSKQEELSSAVAEVHNLAEQLKSVCKSHDQEQLEDILNEITCKNYLLTEMLERKRSALTSYHAKYHQLRGNKQKIREELEEIEAVIRNSFSQKPASYKAALEQWEKSKNLVIQIQSYEEELLKLQQASRDLTTSSDGYVLLVDKTMETLRDRWLYLLGICRDWELYCEELKQEWKLINALMEMEMILLDNCQEEVLDKPEMKQKTAKLLNSIAEIRRFEESLKMQQLQLTLLRCRIQNILGVTEVIPVIQEIHSMKDKCEILQRKAQINKQEIRAELQEREALRDDISAVKKSLLQVSSSLENQKTTDPADARASLEELQSLIDSENEKVKLIVEKLTAQYAELVPAELLSQVRECQVYSQEMEEQVKNEIEQSSPHNIMMRKVNEIKAGLQSIEVRLTKKSETISQAKVLQKLIWDEVDGWHSKLHALESEVQDMAEEDPSQAQEWMDELTEPFSLYQQVTYLVERRTVNLNKAATKLEEYEDNLTITKSWIQNTNNLLSEEMKDCSAKVLNKHVTALEIALDDSEQKLQLLGTIHSELGELDLIFETDSIVERLSELRSQVRDLQEKILNFLPLIQHIANEVVSIENEVKRMEKRVDSIKTILTSSEIDDMSPKDHYNHGQVMLDNINTIRNTVGHIEAYRPALIFSESGVQSLCVFRRMGRLLREAELLEKVTKEQMELLEPIVSEMSKVEQEQEKLKLLSKNFTPESPDVKEKTEAIRKQLEGINQKKEVVLLTQRSSVTEQLERLRLEPHDRDLDSLLSPVTEVVNLVSNEVKRMDSYFLPSLAEETEESTLTAEAADKATADGEGAGLVEPEGANDVIEVSFLAVTSDELSQEQLEDAGKTLGDVKPEMILGDCQGKVTEVEFWLQKVNLSLAEQSQEPDMLQNLEEQLADCQNILQETENKINSLLKDDNCRNQGNEALLEEAESLSIRLKTLKISLEHVQVMLQRYNAVKVEKSLPPSVFKAGDPGDKADVISTEITSIKYPAEKVEANEEICIQPQPRNAAEEADSTLTKHLGKTPLSVIDDITWSKWQYLQKELSYRTKAAFHKHANEPEVAKEVKISFLLRLPVSTVKSPLAEESKHFLTRLKALDEEAADPLTQESARNLHGALFAWLCSVSQWLQNVEEMLDRDVLSREEAASELAICEKLTADLHTLSEEMGYKTGILLKPITHEGAHTSVLSQCYSDVRDWLMQAHIAAKSRSKHMQVELEKHNNYQNDIRQLYDVLVKKKTDLLQHLSNRSMCEAVELLQEAAVYETELQNFESQVSSLNERGDKLSIPICSNQEIHKLEDVLDDTWQILRTKQNQCNSAAIRKSQMDALLRGVSELLSLGKEKIARSKEHRCRSKEGLNSHIQDHKKFFSILDTQVLLLQTLSWKNSSPELGQEGVQTVIDEADLLREEAETHCIYMMGVMKDWDELDSRYDCLNKKFEALKSMVPTNGLVEESEERVTERLNQYKKIKQLIDENESALSQIIVSGKRLQSSVSCPELDAHINMMDQQCSQLTKNVNHELHRLESLVSHLASYNKDSAKLSEWLESAHQRLNGYRMQSLEASQNLGTIKNSLATFFEFTNDVDQKCSLKTSVLNTGTQLLRLKEADTAVLKVSLAKYEERWTELIAALPPIQEKLQKLLMEKLPSLEAIQGLMDWMKVEEDFRELQSTQNSPSTAADVRELLQKYKISRKEMSHKQGIVDFVNQSLLQLSVGDVESKRYQRAEFAELLGALNLRWNQMQGDLNRKIQHFEQTLESISDQESGRQTVNNWFDAQQRRLEKLHRPSSIRAAESALAECTALEEQITAKLDVIEELERNRVATGDQTLSNEGVLTTETLLKKRDLVAKQVEELKTSTHSALQHWKDCSENHGHVDRMIVKLLYVLEQSKIPSPSLNCLKHRMKRLQVVQEEVEQREENWSKLRTSLSSLEALCSPTVLAILEQECRDSRDRWAAASEELSGHLRSGGVLLQLWEDYAGSCEALTPHMEQVEEKCEQLMCAKLSEDRVRNTLQERIQDLHVLEQNLRGLRAHNLQVSELADKVMRQYPAAAEVIQSERQNTSHRIAHLERSASSKAAEMTSIQNEVESFKNDLEKFQSCVKSSADVVGHVCVSEKEKEEKSEAIKKHLLELSELTNDVDRLNEEVFTLPLDDRTQMSLQNLNRMWAKTMSTALEDCREQRMIELEKNNFIQNYETWMRSLEKMENSLTVGIAGTFEALRKQQEIYERLQAEIAINEHILPSFVNKALSVLEMEGEENRNELILKLTSLKEKWQSVIRLVQQRKREISVLLKQWRQFRVSKQRLGKYLLGLQDAVTNVSHQKCHSLFNAGKLLNDFKDKELRLKRLQPSYLTTINDCKDLLAVAAPECQPVLQQDLAQLQDQWESTARQLQAILTHFSDVTQKRQHFGWKLEDRRHTLHKLKERVDEPLPTLHEELERAKEAIEELQEALDEWGDSLRDLDNMKTELSQYVIAEDGMVLKNQVEALHRQWEELCLRVNLRKQDIEDRLNAWNVFNEKNKELCDWLTQMEGKVLQTADVNIEEMIEKLQKDCMEEINLFSENKLHLKQIGDQLIIASNKARSTDIENKLNKVNDRWKHLFDLIGSRVKKLKETLVIIQQLYKNMSNLRTWLARIESELSKPVIYGICHDQEINNKLEEQRDLQKDIEQHNPGVASVLNICERLLHDTDACANETECESIQQTTRSLEKRWRNICAMSMERRVRIEETWSLWQKFLEDYSRFDEWLKDAETMAASPDSSDVLYTKAKEEQKKFEAFQRQIHERLTHLELINKQYRRLARENRTDAASRLKQMVHEGNQRWDQLQKRVAAVLRRLKHFTSQREDFEGTRDSILVWLTEMDLQLTNVEHFSESDIEEKMQQLVGFKQQITLNTNKIDQLIVFGEQLIQKSEAMDAVVIEDELEEIHRYCQEVFGRVYRFHERLTSRDWRLEEDRETSENDTDGEDSREIQNSSWHSTLPDVETSHQSLCHLMPPTLPHERSGRETPVSVDSIPLEWDPTVDVGGSSMHENEDGGAYYNPLSDVEIPENPEAYVIMTTKTVQASSGKSDTPSWHSPEKIEMVTGLLTATTGDTASSNQSSTHTSSVKMEKETRTTSSTNNQLEDKGLPGMDSPETHSGVIERWEIIHAQSLSNELRMKQSLQQWQQLNSDLDNITLWLDKTEVDIGRARKLKSASTVQELEQKVKRLKDTLKPFDHYKVLVLSANLSSKEFQRADESECRNVLSRLHKVNSRWDKVCNEGDKWRESLQSDLLQCEEFQEKSHQLLLWLTEAEDRRLRYRVTDCSGDQQSLLESQKQLMQLKGELSERQIEGKSLQDLCSYLLGSTAEVGYIEVEERTHVIGTKMSQILEDVSQDLNTVQKALDNSTTDEVDSLSSATSYNQAQVGAALTDSSRTRERPDTVKEPSKKRSFFYRVLRAAFPLQILLLLLLLCACMIPFSEEDYSCAQTNNFARSFYPMLRYTNGPPPT
ncbi:nesprin-2 [Mixophyes fleayi]|uniref:nesprin-2 n=1 Tax=Mixophyes fleayi TaxID=3061075 RepID=UPI003F4DF702